MFHVRHSTTRISPLRVISDVHALCFMCPVFLCLCFWSPYARLYHIFICCWSCLVFHVLLVFCIIWLFSDIYYMSASSRSPSSDGAYCSLFLRRRFGVFGRTSLFQFAQFYLMVVHSVAVHDISVRFAHLGASMDFSIMVIFVCDFSFMLFHLYPVAFIRIGEADFHGISVVVCVSPSFCCLFVVCIVLFLRVGFWHSRDFLSVLPCTVLVCLLCGI